MQPIGRMKLVMCQVCLNRANNPLLKYIVLIISFCKNKIKKLSYNSFVSIFCFVSDDVFNGLYVWSIASGFFIGKAQYGGLYIQDMSDVDRPAGRRYMN